MSDQNDMLKMLYDNNRRLAQTETREVPGNIPGFTSFYDTGTFTPTYLGGTTAGVTTYTLQQGAWVRLGNVVIATGTVVWSAATGTGAANISLPFTSQNVANQFFSGSVRVDGVTFANGTPEVIVSPNSAFFFLVTPITNAASPALVVEAAGNVVFTISYFV